jgi:hypothetical protein
MGKYIAEVDDRLILPARVRLTPGAERQSRSMGKTVPSPITVRLIIDTGSGRSTLSPSIISQLKPLARETVQVHTSLARGTVFLFWVSLEFPGTALKAISEMAVARLALPSPLHAFHGVIGRDLLSRWEYLLFEGRRGRFTIRDDPRWLPGWLWR